jgi:hypothetical protein
MSHGKLPTVEEASRRYAHGTYARFCLGKCRCFDCKLAHSTYANERYRRAHNPWRLSRRNGKTVVYNKRTGEIADPKDAQALLMTQYEPDEQLISTDEVRVHVAALQKAGMGLKHIARSADFPYSCLQRIVIGEIRRTRRSSAEKILSVGRSDLPDAANVDGAPSYALIQRLRKTKYKRCKIAEALGIGYSNLAIWTRPRQWVHLSTARKIHALYLELSTTNPSLPRIDPKFVIPKAQPSTVRGGTRDRTPWTKEEEQILHECYPVLSIDALAKRLARRTPGSITQRACRLGIKRSKRPQREAA